MTSAPDGLMRSVSFLRKRIGIQYFRKDSGGTWGTDRSPYLPMRTASDAHALAPFPGPRGQHRRSSPRPRSSPRCSRPRTPATPRPSQRLLLIGARRRQRRAAELAAAQAPARPARPPADDDGARRPRLPRPARPRPPNAPREIERLTADFNRMLARLEEERVEGGRAVIRAQEEERARIAQDLHDEVNQALTAILLRLQAAALDVPPGLRSELKEIQTLATQAMEELLTLARTLRPTALDDHGLVPALAQPGRRTSASAPASARPSTATATRPTCPTRSSSCSTASRRRASPTSSSTRGASAVRVELSSVGRTVLRVRDDGCGFKPIKGSRRPPRRLRHARARAARRRPPERVLRARRGHDHRTDHGSVMRILIADDHGIVRGGMKLLIDRQPDMEVVAEAGDGVEAFEKALRDQARPVRDGRLDAAHDRPAGRAPDPRAPARDAGAGAVDARRRALRVRRAEGRRVAATCSSARSTRRC